MVVNLTDEELEYTSARVKKATVDRVSKFGRYGDSFDEILNKMCDSLETKAKR